MPGTPTTPYSAQQLAPVREYLVDQAAKRSVEELIERVEQGRARLEEAVRAVPAANLDVPGEGEDGERWTAIDTLQHIVSWNRTCAQQILYVALSGELPPPGDAPALPTGIEELLTLNAETLDSLYAHVREAEPSAYLEIRWEHPFFGQLNWREWLLFLRVHCIDHAGQLTQYLS